MDTVKKASGQAYAVTGTFLYWRVRLALNTWNSLVQYVFCTTDDSEKRRNERKKERSNAVAAVWVTIPFFFANKL
jgi:hypothetical protein